MGSASTHLEGRSKLFQVGQLSLAFRFRHGLALFLQLLLLVLDEPLDISLDRLGSTCGSLSRPQHRQPGHNQAISTSNSSLTVLSFSGVLPSFLGVSPSAEVTFKTGTGEATAGVASCFVSVLTSLPPRAVFVAGFSGVIVEAVVAGAAL